MTQHHPVNFQAEGTEKFSTSQLGDEAASAMDDLGVPGRSKTTLLGQDSESGEQVRVKIATMNLYPNTSDENPNAPEACYENDIIGVGWGSPADDKDHEQLSAADYTQLAFERFADDDDQKAENDFAYFALWLSPGDIVITKNLGPVAMYARVTGPLKHREQSDVEDELRDHDIGFYREVEWVNVSPADAPAKVLSTTCRGTVTLPNFDRATIEQIVDQFEAPIGTVDYEIADRDISGVFAELAEKPAANKSNANQLIDSLSAGVSDNGLETAVCTFIQDQTGAVMHPSSRSHPGVEAIFRAAGENGPETYGVQVKRGSFSNKDELKQFADNHEKLFLFSSSGDTVAHDDIENIDQDGLSSYLIDSPADLPPVEIDRVLRTHDYLQR